jgi:hypothetical protein
MSTFDARISAAHEDTRQGATPCGRADHQRIVVVVSMWSHKGR